MSLVQKIARGEYEYRGYRVKNTDMCYIDGYMSPAWQVYKLDEKGNAIKVGAIQLRLANGLRQIMIYTGASEQEAAEAMMYRAW